MIDQKYLRDLITRAIVVGGLLMPLLWLGLSQAGLTMASALLEDTEVLGVVDASNLAPGDQRCQTFWVINQSEEPLDYRLVFVMRGDLWSCDPGGNSLTYTVRWNPEADRHLEPGEQEEGRLSVKLPLAAGNDCQGKSGRLVVRRGYLSDEDHVGDYECRPYGDRYLCWDVEGKLKVLFGR